MRTVKPKTTATYKSGDETYYIGNEDALNSAKKPIKVITADCLVPENPSEFNEWIGGEDKFGSAMELFATTFAVKEARKHLVGVDLKQASSDERNKVVEKMVRTISTFNLKTILQEEASKDTKVAFTDAVSALDPNAPDFVEKFMKLRKETLGL